MTQQVIGYRRLQQFTDTVLPRKPGPARTSFETAGVWFDVPPDVDGANAARAGFRGRPARHRACCIGILPLFAMCDRQDIGGLSTPLHPDTGRAQVFIYDGCPAAWACAKGLRADRTCGANAGSHARVPMPGGLPQLHPVAQVRQQQRAAGQAGRGADSEPAAATLTLRLLHSMIWRVSGILPALMISPVVRATRSLQWKARSMDSALFRGLNPAQIEAVQAAGWPGAGAGRAGIGQDPRADPPHRLPASTCCGCQPYQILAVTFTNKAAREMIARLRGLIGDRHRPADHRHLPRHLRAHPAARGGATWASAATSSSMTSDDQRAW